MEIFDIIALLISLSALFGYVNHRYFHLPQTIGVMLAGLVVSLGLIVSGWLGWGIREHAADLIGGIDLRHLLLKGMLGLLLFAGALHVNVNKMLEEKWSILALSTVGVVLSIPIVAGLAWAVFTLLGLYISFGYCLLLGAIVSPTDPVAILGVLKRIRASETLQAEMAGESLFNDGVGVVAFVVLLELIGDTGSVSVGHVGFLLLQEVCGGVLFGLVLGFLVYRLLRQIDAYHLEILLTLALAVGGYTLANTLHLSGPLAIVTAGLLIGNKGRAFAMSEITRDRLDVFWEVIDEILNGSLFVLIGLEILALELMPIYLLAGIALIPVVLVARFVSVAVPIGILKFWRPLEPHLIKILTWGGLRGGIALALALSLPNSPARNLLLAITYIVVVFSILVQGLTIEKVVVWSTGQRGSR